MTKKDWIKSFIDEIYNKPPTKIYPTNKTIIKSIDNNWSSDLSDMNDYSPTNNRGYRYILLVTDNFSKFGWTIPLKNKYAQSITDVFSQINKTSRHKPISSKQMMGRSMLTKFAASS